MLILDEPVSALDVSVGAQIVNLLRALQREHGLTYLFISHSMPLVRYLSTRIAVMERGRLVETGEAEALCAEPREAYTRQLLEATPELPAAASWRQMLAFEFARLSPTLFVRRGGQKGWGTKIRTGSAANLALVRLRLGWRCGGCRSGRRGRCG